MHECDTRTFSNCEHLETTGQTGVRDRVATCAAAPGHLAAISNLTICRIVRIGLERIIPYIDHAIEFAIRRQICRRTISILIKMQDGNRGICSIERIITHSISIYMLTGNQEAVLRNLKDDLENDTVQYNEPPDLSEFDLDLEEDEEEIEDEDPEIEHGLSPHL